MFFLLSIFCCAAGSSVDRLTGKVEARVFPRQTKVNLEEYGLTIERRKNNVSEGKDRGTQEAEIRRNGCIESLGHYSIGRYHSKRKLTSRKIERLTLARIKVNVSKGKDRCDDEEKIREMTVMTL